MRHLKLHADHFVFLLLVAIAVVGRIDRLDWNFTPVAAAALFAGFYFRNWLIAALVPLAALAISDFVEPAHNNRLEMLTVWTAMLLPAMLGPWLRAARGKRAQVGRGAVAALLPSAFFFLTTNFAVWLSAPSASSARLVFSRDLAGLMECYTVALPFYGKMLAGDLFFMAVLFGAWAAAMQGSKSREAVVSDG